MVPPSGPAASLTEPSVTGTLLKRVLRRDARGRNGRHRPALMAVNLHPWLIGQPFRIGVLDEALGHMMRRPEVWAASGAEVVDWYRTHPPVA